MNKIFTVIFAVALVSIITISGTATASAKGNQKQPIDISATLFVTGISDPETNPNSGWSTIESETLVGGLVTVNAGPAILGTTVISAQQSSHEQFTSDFLPAANVKKGKSKGTFYLTSYLGGDPLVVGQYSIKVSSIPGCQIWGDGKWKSKAKNSIIDGHGKITVCTNFVPAYGTFVSQVTVTGNAALVD
jgi:hypothetical protein